MTRPVRLLFFTQTLDCETCLQTRQILDELPPLSDKITIEEVNFVLDGRPSAESTASIASRRSPSRTKDEPGRNRKTRRIRFLGAPAGYEFISLVQAMLLVGGGESHPVGRQPRRAWPPSRSRSRCRCSRRRR